MNADEVIIWTDVDGVLTADPRLVPEARTIPVISYREAAELAFFGAKVLHPKTLKPVMQAAIPVWIRNSFAPERPGTLITPAGRSTGGGVKALTAIQDVALISVGGPGIVGLPDVVGRTFSTTAEVRANVLLISQSSSQNDICFIVSAADAQRTVEALRREFAQDLAHEKVEHITVDTNIAIVAVVGENMRGTPGVAGKTFNALGPRKRELDCDRAGIFRVEYFLRGGREGDEDGVNHQCIASLGWARRRTENFSNTRKIHRQRKTRSRNIRLAIELTIWPTVH